jgi:hypothetical protein
MGTKDHGHSATTTLNDLNEITMKTTATWLPQAQCREVRTQITDTDVAAACDPRVILPMVQVDLAHRIADMLMTGLEPKLRTILEAANGEGHD